ncbi:MAG: protein involved in polysaccharide export with SLBB domain [Gammaproteobacteria bacterium]|jgi:protein involved in polysaccharide export with SLBB domain
MSQYKKSIFSITNALLFLVFLNLFSQNVNAAKGAGTKASLPDYVLGTGDMIRIQVYDEDDLYLESRVSDRGTISYPFLGELKVTGFTSKQLAGTITSRLKGDYLINPKVSVDIMEYREFYVNGEVEDPGGFPFQPGVTVRKAISIAGGFKERASKEKINVIHDDDPNGEPKPVKLDAFILPGDIITVEESFF